MRWEIIQNRISLLPTERRNRDATARPTRKNKARPLAAAMRQSTDQCITAATTSATSRMNSRMRPIFGL
jgi:hypothetical protein